jgi:hypothetical protein
LAIRAKCLIGRESGGLAQALHKILLTFVQTETPRARIAFSRKEMKPWTEG